MVFIVQIYIPNIIHTEVYENDLTNAFYDPTQDKFFITNNFELTNINDIIGYSLEEGIICKIKYFNS